MSSSSNPTGSLSGSSLGQIQQQSTQFSIASQTPLSLPSTTPNAAAVARRKTNANKHFIHVSGNGQVTTHTTGSGPGVGPRRSKACEYCRSLKVRCIPSDPDQPTDPCVRCVKGKRDCIFHLGPRKRTRKTDNRVAALVKKVEVLSAALTQQQQTDQPDQAQNQQQRDPDGNHLFTQGLGSVPPPAAPNLPYLGQFSAAATAAAAPPFDPLGNHQPNQFRDSGSPQTIDSSNLHSNAASNSVSPSAVSSNSSRISQFASPPPPASLPGQPHPPAPPTHHLAKHILSVGGNNNNGYFAPTSVPFQTPINAPSSTDCVIGAQTGDQRSISPRDNSPVLYNDNYKNSGNTINNSSLPSNTPSARSFQDQKSTACDDDTSNTHQKFSIFDNMGPSMGFSISSGQAKPLSISNISATPSTFPGKLPNAGIQANFPSHLHHLRSQNQSQTANQSPTALPQYILNSSSSSFAIPFPSSISNTDFDILAIRNKLIVHWRAMATQDAARLEHIRTAPRMRSPCIEEDLIVQGIISEEEAEYRFKTYLENFHKQYPVITLAPGLTVLEMRRDMPMLFLTIMGIVSGAMRKEEPDTANGKPTAAYKNSGSEENGKDATASGKKFYTDFKKALVINSQWIDCLMYEVMILGKKNLDLLKCLVLSTVWYNTPEMQHYHKSHLLTHMCITMAFDMGLAGNTSSPAAKTPQNTGVKSPGQNGGTITGNDPNGELPSSTVHPIPHPQATLLGRGGGSRDIKYDRILRPFTLLDPRTYECRKMWLCVYICSVNVSIVLKRPVYMMWSRHTEECCEMLEQPDRPDEDRLIAIIARLNRILEQISSSLQSADPHEPPNMDDPRTQTLIKSFEWQLQSQFPQGLLGNVVNFTYYMFANYIYLHENALYVPLSPQLGRSPFSDYSLALGELKLTQNAAWSIGSCFTAATGIIDMFVSQPILRLACCSIFSYSRLVIGVSILLKLRQLFLTVPDFKHICMVTPNELNRVNVLLSKLDKVTERYPFANTALNYCLVLRILIYHYDRQLHFYFEDMRTKHEHEQQQQGQQQQQQQQQQQNDQQKQQPSRRGSLLKDSVLLGSVKSRQPTPGGPRRRSNSLGAVYPQVANNFGTDMPSNKTRKRSLSNSAVGGPDLYNAGGSCNDTASNLSASNPNKRRMSVNMDHRFSEIVPGSPLDILSNIAAADPLSSTTLNKGLNELPNSKLNNCDTNNDSNFVGNGSFSGESGNATTSNNNSIFNMGRANNQFLQSQSATTNNSSGAPSMPFFTAMNTVPISAPDCNGDTNTTNGNIFSSSYLGGTGAGSGTLNMPPPPPMAIPENAPLDPAAPENMLPQWLFTDDSWKDLVFGAESLSGFEMFG